MSRKLWFSCALVWLFGAPAPAAAAEEAPSAAPAAPETVKETTTGMELVRVQGGCFPMGNPFDAGGPEEKPVHEVCVGDFLLGETEVTQAQWKKVMGKNPAKHADCDDCPVEQVSWRDAQAFLAKLNAPPKGKGTPGTWRLPTEAEWEYAARSGGKNELYAGGDDDLDHLAWYQWSADFKTHPVGGLRPNGLGLFDMTGNVWEWTADWYAPDYYAKSPRANPTGPASGDRRVLRGGSYAVVAFDARTTYRNFLPPDHRAPAVGFRVARSAPAGAK